MRFVGWFLKMTVAKEWLFFRYLPIACPNSQCERVVRAEEFRQAIHFHLGGTEPANNGRKRRSLANVLPPALGSVMSMLFER